MNTYTFDSQDFYPGYYLVHCPKVVECELEYFSGSKWPNTPYYFLVEARTACHPMWLEELSGIRFSRFVDESRSEQEIRVLDWSSEYVLESRFREIVGRFNTTWSRVPDWDTVTAGELFSSRDMWDRGLYYGHWNCSENEPETRCSTPPILYVHDESHVFCLSWGCDNLAAKPSLRLGGRIMFPCDDQINDFCKKGFGLCLISQ